MKVCGSRKGSALLIVLGMLTFLIVSAVGFSAYMRYGRLPSSNLRRAVSGRQLVKAAMVEAIDQLDQAIADNPHPGVGTKSPSGPNRNIWEHRIFMGTNSTARTDAEFRNTVSPLCLEALAYIPPPLVNEARYFSRFSPAAEWKPFDFDIGRYAFCAIDVSDYFDINRLFANEKRSSAPDGRISLSYIFEDFKSGKDHAGPGEKGAASWDDFMNEMQFRTVDEKTGEISFDKTYPLISLADFNLAVGDRNIGGITSPFCKYVTGSGSNGFYNDGQNNSGNNAAKDAEAFLPRMTFVTDGLFPQTDYSNVSGEERYDITDTKYQFFAPDELSKYKTDNETLSEILLSKNFKGDKKFQETMNRYLSRLGCVALYDYLDVNSIPLSVALPTVERFPMICGVQPKINGAKFGIIKETQPAGDTGDESKDSYPNTPVGENQREVKKIVRYKVDAAQLSQGFKGAKVNALTVFPFPRSVGEHEKFTIDGQMSFFFSSEKMKLRTGGDMMKDEESDLIHLPKDIKKTAYDKDRGTVNIKFEETAYAPKDVIKEEDAVEKHSFDILDEHDAIVKAFEEIVLLEVEYKWIQTAQKDPQGLITGWTPVLKDVIERKDPKDIEKINDPFCVVKANGEKDPDFNTSRLKELVSGDAGKEIYLNCAAWFRVKQESGEKKVVDMVPACLYDDNIQNNTDIESFADNGYEFGDAAFPLLKFDTGISFVFTIDKLEEMAAKKDGDEMNISKSVIVADPRYNHAPEEWFDLKAELECDAWLQNCKVGDGDRDGDIFMAVSDAGYLQSAYEFAFLPRITDLNAGGDMYKAKNLRTEKNDRTELAEKFDDTRNKDIAWRTYDPFVADADSFLKMPFVSEGRGYKVNPYSDSTNVIMSVFANSPQGWRYASTNIVSDADAYFNHVDLSMVEFNQDYAFNAYASEPGAKIEWEYLEKVAGKFINALRANPDKRWEDVFCDLGWLDGDEKTLCGVNLNSDASLWETDKKFLYGFWKDCFAVKQQLFLVFVRAEPTMRGSSASGHTPPQLGGKAVALVWRDPANPKSAPQNGRATPHRMRVLFYKQFE
jgi:hypothetical protein